MFSFFNKLTNKRQPSEFANKDLIKIENFLSEEDFNTSLDEMDVKSGRKSGQIPLLTPAVEIVRRTAEKKFIELNNYSLRHALIKYEGKKSVLHHDLNTRPHRKFSLILYLIQSAAGGETFFPFFDRKGNLASNEITTACSELNKREQYSLNSPELEKLIINNKEDYLHFKPVANTAIGMRTENLNLWHFVAPEKGERIAMILFWEPRE